MSPNRDRDQSVSIGTLQEMAGFQGQTNLGGVTIKQHRGGTFTIHVSDVVDSRYRLTNFTIDARGALIEARSELPPRPEYGELGKKTPREYQAVPFSVGSVISAVSRALARTGCH